MNLVVLTLAALAAGVVAGAPPAAAQTPGFVARDGELLMLNGRPYRFSGANMYNANSDGWCGFQYSDAELRSAFEAIRDASDPNVYPTEGAVVRAWFFQSLAASREPGTQGHRWSGRRDWGRFDRTLDVAQQTGVRLIVTLTDQWGECGDFGATGYKGIEWYQGGYLLPDAGQIAESTERGYDRWVSYREWVEQVVRRYRDRPEILAWQLINEGEAKAAGASSCEEAAEAAAFAALRDWATDISSLVRSLDPDHLISLGTIGSGQCGTAGDHYAQLHALPDIDLCELHDYGDLRAVPGDQWNGMQVRIDQCRALDKPIFVGEVGIEAATVGGVGGRADVLAAKFGAQSSRGVVGHLAWVLNPRWPGEALDDTYDIGPTDPALLVLARDRVVEPSVPRDVRAEPRDGGACIDWRAPARDGGSPVRGYQLRVAPGGRVLHHGPQTNVCIGDLDNGTAYTFTVTANNDPGLGHVLTSPLSAPSDPVVPERRPAAPTDVSATAGDRSATVAWTPGPLPVHNPITGYRITGVVTIDANGEPAGTPRPEDPGISVTVGPDQASAVVTGLQNGATYAFRVEAVSAVGIGDPTGYSNAVTPAPPPAPEVVLDPASVELGTVDVGQAADATVTVRNTGDADLLVSAIDIVGANRRQFALGSEDCTLAPVPPGGSCAVGVRFAPTEAGSKSATLEIASNAPAGPATASLAGVAAPVMDTLVVEAPAGATVATGGVEGATATDPVATSVTVPVAGTVSITETAAPEPLPTGYSFAGQGVTITAPGGTIDAPLRIELRLDALAIPVGHDETTLELFRDGQLVPPCADPASGRADPAPCIVERARAADGDVVLVALTVAASDWAIGHGKAPQEIRFPSIPPQEYRLEPIRLRAKATSGLPVTYGVSGPCSVDGVSLTLTGIGRCEVTAFQPGDETWAEAGPLTRAFRISKGRQSIDFARIGQQSLGAGPIELVATASSGLPVTFSASGACSVDDTSLTLFAVGRCEVTASQPGNELWKAAQETRSFRIRPAPG